MANTVIALKKSATPAATPSTLANGELAINYADGKLYYKHANGSIIAFNTSGGVSFGTVNANGTLVVADTSSGILSIVPGNGMQIVGDAINDKITFSADIGPAFDKANAANLLAYNTGIGANAFASATVSGANTIAIAAFAKANSGTAGANIGDTAPTSPSNGSLWWSSSVGSLFIYYNDGTSGQWVEAFPSNLYANTVGGLAYDKANTANATAIAAFNQANTANIVASNAYNQANSIPILTVSNQTISAAGVNNSVYMTPLQVSYATGPDIRALAMMVSELKGDRINMPNGIFDPLQDTSDVGTLTNADTSTAGKIIGTLLYGTNQCTGGTGIAIDSGALGAISNAFNGNVSNTDSGWVSSTANAPNLWIGYDFGSGVTKKIRKIMVLPGYLGDASSYNVRNFNLEYSDNNSTWTSAGSFTATDTFTQQTFTISDNGSHRYWRIKSTSTLSRMGVVELQMFESSGFNNLTLISNAFTAASTPTKGRLAVQAKPIDSITINTDLIGYVSRDGGTTYTTATLASETTLADGTILYVQDGMDISSQPSGTSIVWKVITQNNKNVEINGIGLRWL